MQSLNAAFSRILPQLVKLPSIYDFWVEFIPALQKHKLALQNPGQESSSDDAPAGPFDDIMQICLSAAITQWDSVVAQPRPSYPYYTGNQQHVMSSKISRATQLVDLCLSAQNLQTCERLLVMVLRNQGELPTKFNTLFIPMIPELKQRLARHEVEIASHPFGAFFRSMIGVYLEYILGSKPRQVHVPTIRKIGCGCFECNSVNTFLLSADSQQTFRYVQNRRIHLEGFLRGVPDLVTFSTIRSGSPHGLVVTKNNVIVAATQWLVRQKDAKAFLGKIGNDEVIARIMGPRYGDVLEALKGTMQFKMASAAGTHQLHDASPSGGQPGTSNPALTSAPSSVPVMPILGNKRKRTPGVHGDVIDLTRSSP